MKPKPLSKTVHPAIRERAEQSNQNFNKHLAALREQGYTNQAGISLETSVLMVEAASIISGVKELHDGE